MDEVLRLEAIKLNLEAKVARLSKQRDQAKQQYEAVTTALELLSGRQVNERQAKSIGINPEEIAGKSLKEALLHIAERCDGVLRVTPARKLLIDAQVLSNGQSGSNRINAALGEMLEFRRTDRRGTYCLVDEPDELEL